MTPVIGDTDTEVTDEVRVKPLMVSSPSQLESLDVTVLWK